jgi:hypothetical protein
MFESVRKSATRLISRVRQMKIRESNVTDPAQHHEGVLGVDVAKELPAVIPATRFTVVAFSVALLATGVVVLLPTVPQAMTQWAAILGFTLAWAAISQGVYRGKLNWLSGTCLVALRWWIWTFVPVTAIGLLFGS